MKLIGDEDELELKQCENQEPNKTSEASEQQQQQQQEHQEETQPDQAHPETEPPSPMPAFIPKTNTLSNILTKKHRKQVLSGRKFKNLNFISYVLGSQNDFGTTTGPCCIVHTTMAHLSIPSITTQKIWVQTLLSYALL